MRKIFLSLVAVISAVTMMAQTPTVSTSAITLRYCNTKTHTTDTTINADALPFIWDGDSLKKAGTYERLYTAADGCDSIAKLNLKTVAYPKYLAYAKNELIISNTSYDTYSYDYMPSALQAKFDNYKATEDIYVVLAPGNLQYQASTNTFRFAEHGYIWLGNDNLNISSTNTGWIDMFGWGTSGYNVSNGKHAPYYSNTTNSYYRTSPWNDNYDWGVYNAIQNGDNTDPAGTWFTPVGDLMQRLLFHAAEHEKLGCGSVNGVKGWIVLPQFWEQPTNTPVFVPQTIVTTQTATKSDFIPAIYANWANNNIYTEAQWAAMEEAGAIFFIADDIYPRVGTAFSTEWPKQPGFIAYEPAGSYYHTRNTYYRQNYSSSFIFATSLKNDNRLAPYFQNTNIYQSWGIFVRLIKLYTPQ